MADQWTWNVKITRHAAVMVCLASAVCVAPSARAQQRTRHQDSVAVVALEHEWLSGLHDAHVLDRVLAPDFRHLLATGQVITKAQHISFMVAQPATPGQTLRFDRLDVALVGDMAIADGTVSRNGPSAVISRSAFTDVFVYRNGRWQAVHAQETEEPQTAPARKPAN